jgi:S1-C subfamily serine protease
LFQRGDLITHVGDKQITSVQTLTTAAATIAGGKAVFSVVRDGRPIQVNVALPAK